MAEPTSPSPYLFVGNDLSLDFINTEIVAEGRRVSLIQDYADFRRWLIASGAVEPSIVAAAERDWNGAERRRIVAEALAFRALLRRMAERLAAGEALSE